MPEQPRTPWQIAIEPDPIRPADTELMETPDLDRLVAAGPDAEQVLYRVTYERVGRRGGRGGSTPPPALTVWALDEADLEEQIHRDVRQYLGSKFYDVLVDLDKLRGSIVTGSLAGRFTIERLASSDTEAKPPELPHTTAAPATTQE